MGDEGGFSVASQRLTDVGASVASAAARVGQLDVRTPLTRAAAALPGSASAAAVGELSAAWSAAGGEVARGLARHAAALAAAADDYRAGDAAAAAVLPLASELPAGWGGEGR